MLVLLETNGSSPCSHCSGQGDSQKYREEDGVPLEAGLAVSLLFQVLSNFSPGKYVQVRD
jgi:hypothetical protein